MREILLDSQSPADVIVNLMFVINIRLCKWILRLLTQIGDCCINLIADLPGVGTVWFYPPGVANILSQYRMAVFSNWDIEYSTKRFKKLGDVRDLSYNCVTSEGVEVRFDPTEQGLHVMDCTNYVGDG